jgi:hypothetical protein
MSPVVAMSAAAMTAIMPMGEMVEGKAVEEKKEKEEEEEEVCI